MLLVAFLTLILFSAGARLKPLCVAAGDVSRERLRLPHAESTVVDDIAAGAALS